MSKHHDAEVIGEKDHNFCHGAEIDDKTRKAAVSAYLSIVIGVWAGRSVMGGRKELEQATQIPSYLAHTVPSPSLILGGLRGIHSQTYT